VKKGKKKKSQGVLTEQEMSKMVGFFSEVIRERILTTPKKCQEADCAARKGRKKVGVARVSEKNAKGC